MPHDGINVFARLAVDEQRMPDQVITINKVFEPFIHSAQDTRQVHARSLACFF